MNLDDLFIRRCFQLAKNGLGNVSPNPLVGCVLAVEDKIIGEGFHQQYGGLHAEPNAISNVKNTLLIPESTLYVNLEPCSHYGKTPPCADLIIEKKIKNVVICNLDPNPLVAGKGIRKLKEAGINVREKVLEEEGLELNRRFFTFMTQKRPYVILKWAQALDGFMDIDRSINSSNYWITNNRLKTLVHKWRTEEDAIMVGTTTIQNDNPLLTARQWRGENPIRVVIDNSLRLDKNSAVFNQDAQTLVYTSKQEKSTENIEYIKTDFSNLLPNILEDLYQKGVQSVIVEGGKELLHSFISSSLWDEARVLIGNKVFVNGLKAPEIPFLPEDITSVEDDKILFYRNRTH